MSHACAVVTGGGRGIGRAVALGLARRGFDVALLGRTFASVETTASEVIAVGRRALPLRCDVARSEEVAAAREAIVRALGAPRVVVNNAGILRSASVTAMGEEDWDAVLDVNLKGTFLVTRAFLPSMLESGEGRFVAMASISGALGTPRLSAYCASKWGVVGFTKALAEELRGTGVQAMCVMPGSVDTEMLKESGFAPQMTPEHVAGVVVYAALDAPPAMNGSAIEVFGP